MRPEQIRAKQKVIAAYRQFLAAFETLKTYAPILVPGEREIFHAIDKLEAAAKQAREGIEALQAIPDTAELFLLGRTVRVSSINPELPPEGPGIEDHPDWPGCDTE